MIYLAMLMFGCAEPTPELVVSTDLDPGYKPVSRLTRTEYNRTFHELVGIDKDLAESFPADAISFGFDNMADALSVPPAFVELHESAVDEALDHLFGRNDQQTETIHVEAENPNQVIVSGGVTVNNGHMIEEGHWLSATLFNEHDGAFELTLAVVGDGTPQTIELEVDGVWIGAEVFDGPMGVEDVWRVPLQLESGLHNYLIRHKAGDPGSRVMIDWIEVEGPLDPTTGVPPAWFTYVTCTIGTAGCAEEVIGNFGLHAWRRPLTDSDVADFLPVYESALHMGWSHEDALQLSLKAVLLSPEFLYRLEIAPSGASGGLDSYELATRLSYFLWSTTPDDTLLQLAAVDRVVEPEVLQGQVTRLLEDPRADALASNFAAQWFGIRSLEDAAPNSEIYPDFDEELRAAMAEEMQRFAEELLLTDRSMVDLLVARETWMNGRLADHYGATHFGDPQQWLRIALPGADRLGLLTMPGWLTLNSDPDRPSEVQRGKWILDNILCTQIPPPPADLDTSDVVDDEVPESVRDQTEAGRTYAGACTGCHGVMDPMGFALGEFDGIGATREVDELGFPIDINTALIDGTPIGAPSELGLALASDPQFARCVAEKTYSYALGRAVNRTDAPTIERLAAEFTASDYRFETLVRGVVASPAFKLKPTPESEASR